MDKDIFWKIIDEVNSEVDHNNQEAIIDATEEKLMKISSNDIVDWHNIKATYMDLAYRNNLWAACAATRSHYTDDGFIDFRSWLVSRGKEVYMNALNDPDTLADIDIPEGSANFEKYGYVACYTYAKKAALEKEGPNSILLDYTSWIAENSERLLDSFEKCPLRNIDNNQRLINAYIRKLSIKYDIHDALDKEPLCKETIAEIMSEIKLKPDIGSDWSILDLPKILPRLYEKYEVEQVEDISINIKMEQ